MLLLAVIVASLPPPAPPRVQAEAVATARILKSSLAGRRAWGKSPEGLRREVRIRDELGRELVLRLIENE
jgi:hypothetical protein